MNKSELAFENFHDDVPQTLYRLVALRYIGDEHREMRHTNWFLTEEAADEHAKWINDGRGRVLSITRYEAISGSGGPR